MNNIKWSKADLHIHTTYSDGVMEPEDVMNYMATYTDFRVLAITDHNTMDGAFRAADYRKRNPDIFKDLDMIVGEEVSSREGHIVGLFLTEYIPPHMSAAKTVEAIHSQGGLAIAAHPYTHWMVFAGLLGVKSLIGKLPFDAVEVRNSNVTEIYANPWSAHRNCKLQQLPIVGSSDAHFLQAVGKCYTRFKGRTPEDLRRAIVNGEVRAGGRVWGPIILLRYVYDQVRRRGPIIPDRSKYRMVSGELEIGVDDIWNKKITILALAGALNYDTAPTLKERVKDILSLGERILIFDLSELHYLDSAGIGVLLAAAKYAGENEGAIRICGIRKKLKLTIKLTRLDKLFAFFEDRAAALRDIGRKT